MDLEENVKFLGKFSENSQIHVLRKTILNFLLLLWRNLIFNNAKKTSSTNT